MARRSDGALQVTKLAEARDDAGGKAYYLLGLRLRRGASVSFREVERQVREALKGLFPYGRSLQCTDLDRDIDPQSLEFLHGIGRRRDPRLGGIDFLGDGNLHGASGGAGGARAN